MTSVEHKGGIVTRVVVDGKDVPWWRLDGAIVLKHGHLLSNMLLAREGFSQNVLIPYPGSTWDAAYIERRFIYVDRFQFGSDAHAWYNAVYAYKSGEITQERAAAVAGVSIPTFRLARDGKRAWWIR